MLLYNILYNILFCVVASVVYRKPKHTGQYLPSDSHHHTGSKYSVIDTLYHRTKTVPSIPELLRTEKEHSRSVLTKCKYPHMVFEKMESKNFKQNKKTIGYIIIPYMKDLWESFKKICRLVRHPKLLQRKQYTKEHPSVTKSYGPHVTKNWSIYRFRCHKLDSDDEYIGESARTHEARFKEHLKAPSSICGHHSTTGYHTILDDFSIVGRERQGLTITIKGSMFIRITNPTLNRHW